LSVGLSVGWLVVGSVGPHVKILESAYVKRRKRKRKSGYVLRGKRRRKSGYFKTGKRRKSGYVEIASPSRLVWIILVW
jgi:hypothetical protein